MRAHQKDAYFESSFRLQIQDVLNVFKGQRFINTHPEEITVAAKSLYLMLTTLIGSRTLGEEYVDLIYVNRSGNRLPKLLPRIGFILSYAVVPYIISRLVRKVQARESKDDQSWIVKFCSSYSKVLDTVLNLHIAIFYFLGQFYSISRRIFGLRYAFGHNKSPKDMSKAGNYSFLGALILIQFAVKSIIKLKAYTDQNQTKATEKSDLSIPGKYESISQLEEVSNEISENQSINKLVNIDLSNPGDLPYIPENSRACMLCLSPMINPSASTCGHLFCWDCIVDWIREHPECPLCRQLCLEQNILPLR